MWVKKKSFYKKQFLKLDFWYVLCIVLHTPCTCTTTWETSRPLAILSSPRASTTTTVDSRELNTANRKLYEGHENKNNITTTLWVVWITDIKKEILSRPQRPLVLQWYFLRKMSWPASLFYCLSDWLFGWRLLLQVREVVCLKKIWPVCSKYWLHLGKYQINYCPS